MEPYVLELRLTEFERLELNRGFRSNFGEWGEEGGVCFKLIKLIGRVWGNAGKFGGAHTCGVTLEI